MTDFKSSLNDKFKIKDLGLLKYFLSLQVARPAKGTYITQRHYALEILNDFSLLGSKATHFPMDPDLKLTKIGIDLLSDPTAYRRLVGRLLYLVIIRPDLSYFVKVLSQYMDKPTHSHMTSAQRVLRYLKSRLGKGIFMSACSSCQLKAFSDFD